MKIITYEKENQLTDLQIQLIEKLNNDIQSVLELTINELADSIFINISTLSRLIKKLGLKIIVNLKYELLESIIISRNLISKKMRQLSIILLIIFINCILMH